MTASGLGALSAVCRLGHCWAAVRWQFGACDTGDAQHSIPSITVARQRTSAFARPFTPVSLRLLLISPPQDETDVDETDVDETEAGLLHPQPTKKRLRDDEAAGKQVGLGL